MTYPEVNDLQYIRSDDISIEPNLISSDDELYDVGLENFLPEVYPKVELVDDDDDDDDDDFLNGEKEDLACGLPDYFLRNNIPSLKDINSSKVTVVPIVVTANDNIISKDELRELVTITIPEGNRFSDQNTDFIQMKFTPAKWCRNVIDTINRNPDIECAILLDQNQRNYKNDMVSKKTFANDLGHMKTKNMEGSIDSHDDFANKHEVAYEFCLYQDPSAPNRPTYNSAINNDYRYKLIILLIDGLQRTMMFLLIFFEGGYTRNLLDTSGDQWRYSYFDLSAFYPYYNSKGILCYKIFPSHLSAQKSGHVFLSADEVKEFKANRTKKLDGEYINLIPSQEFGKLDSYVRDGQLDVIHFVENMIAKHDLRFTRAAAESFINFTRFIYDRLFVCEDITVDLDTKSTPESNTERFLQINGRGLKMNKESMINSKLNGVSGVRYSKEILDPISDLYRMCDVKNPEEKATRTLVSGNHKNTKLYFKDQKLREKLEKTENPLLLHGKGNGTINEMQNTVLNNDQEATIWAKFFLTSTADVEEACKYTKEFFYADKTQNLRPSMNFMTSLDDDNKALMVHFIFITYFNMIVEGSNFDPYLINKKYTQASQILRVMFGLKPITNSISTEISQKTKFCSNISRDLVINKLKFTPDNLKNVCEHRNCNWSPIMSLIVERDFTNATRNKDDSNYLHIVSNLLQRPNAANKQADHIHPHSVINEPSKVTKKIDANFSGSTAAFKNEFKRFIVKYNNTPIGKMLLDDKANKSKGDEDPSIFFDENVVLRPTIKSDYKMNMSDEQVIEILKFRNIIARMVHTQKTRLLEYATLNYGVCGEDSMRYPLKTVTNELAFDTLLQATNMEHDYPTLYDQVMNTSGSTLSRDTILSLQEL
jgi:hypothetical protein